MSYASNVIPAEFGGRPPLLTREEDDERAAVRHLIRLAERSSDVADRVVEICVEMREHRDYWRAMCLRQARRARRLERELRDREYAPFTFTDDELFAAMPAVRIRASALAELMFPGLAAPHGIIVRIGQALGRLEARGLTRRHHLRGDGYRYGFEWEAVSA